MEEENLNYKLYEESFKELKNLKKKMSKFYLENLPREDIIKFLKKKKIIESDWVKGNNKYKEKQNGK
jgi:hypothetical protein